VRRLREIVPGILIATADAYVTNSTAVAGRNGGCLLVDPAVTVADLRLLAADLTGHGLRPELGFATHPHWDHVLWHRELGTAARLATAAAASAAQRDRASMIAAARAEAPGHDLELFGRLRPLDPGQEVISWAGPPALVLAHDGHAPGHAALFLADSGVLIAGDMCSDIEIPLLDPDAPDPVGDYRAGLELLAGLRGVLVLIPGHGSVADAAGMRVRVAADFRYLDALERGEDFGDSRLGASWLRAAHVRQLRQARGEPR
jgi:hydroxyacylglutathione hydrolase